MNSRFRVFAGAERARRVSPRFFWQLVAAVTFCATAAFFLRLNSGVWSISPDSTVYVEGARSLARLAGYVDARGLPLAHYPPGTSALYALAALIPATDYVYFNLLTKFLTIGFIWLVFVLIRRSAGIGAALLTVCFLTFSQILIHESTHILSDLAFIFCLAATMALFPQEKLESMSAGWAVLLGVLATCAYLVRVPGLFLYLGYTAYIALHVKRNRWRTIAIVSAVLFPVVLAVTLTSATDPQGSYLRLMFLRRQYVLDSGFPTLADWYARISLNARTIVRLIYVTLANQSRVGIAGVVLYGFLVAGFAAALRSRRSTLHLWLVAFTFPRSCSGNSTSMTCDTCCL